MKTFYNVGSYDSDSPSTFESLAIPRIWFADGGLWLYGDNTSAAIGNNSLTSRSSPVQTIAGGINWKQVDCGWFHTGAIKSDGTLWMWGGFGYMYGQLGDNTNTAKSSPVQTVAYGTNWKQIVCNGYNSLAIKSDGTLWTWGANTYGQLGDNTTGQKSSPVQTVTFSADWKQASLGVYHAGAIKTDGTLWMWGWDTYGTLGLGVAGFNKSSPIQTVTFGTNWKQVSCGSDHSTAIKTDGTLWVWGNNNYGQLGLNDTTMRSSPIQTIAYGTNWKQVQARGPNTAAIKTDGTLWVWGRNQSGQLGRNDTTSRSSPIQTVAYGTNWKQVNCGDAGIVAIKTDGTLWGWGLNSLGQLGDNTATNKSSPVQTVMFGTNWKQVSTNYSVTAAVKDDNF